MLIILHTHTVLCAASVSTVIALTGNAMCLICTSVDGGKFSPIPRRVFLAVQLRSLDVGPNKRRTMSMVHAAQCIQLGFERFYRIVFHTCCGVSREMYY